MDVAIVTGSAGLIGAETVRFFAGKGLVVVGIDNDMRRVLLGDEASTTWNRDRLLQEVPGYIHRDEDIRDTPTMQQIFAEHGRDVRAVIHTAAQPSHDWAATDPFTDFAVNADATLALLEMTRRHCPSAVFIYMSTNKVYGDTPNSLPLVEAATRWEVEASHPFYEHGIDESMSIDRSTHSLFGVSKAAADLLVQEYGRYFGMKTACFRGGCLTGPGHSGTQLHGFLAYLAKCAVTCQPYTVFGYKGKQVRDNIHSSDLVSALWHFYQAPRVGAVYNVGGGRQANCSVLEAIELCQQITGRPLAWSYREANRSGDHIWWISDTRKFKQDYPAWRPSYDLRAMVSEICTTIDRRLSGRAPSA
jgi:CDP-paratose 2-epimerase